MQKLKEYLDKEKDLSELIPDLSKNLQKSLEKLSEILKDLLDPSPQKPLVTDPDKLTTYLNSIKSLVKSLFNSYPPGAHSFDISEFENISSSTIELKWSPLHPFPELLFTKLKSDLISLFAYTLKKLIKLLGPSSLHPKVFKLCRKLVNFLGYSQTTCRLLSEFLKSVGNSATDLVLYLLNKENIVARVLKDLQVLTCQETVTLNLCKKNSKKKIGNGHQRRHHKVVMKINENKLLKNISPVEDCQINLGELAWGLRVLHGYLESNPTEPVDLDSIYSVNVTKLPETLKYLVLDIMFNYSVLYKKQIKKLKSVLESLLKDLNFRSTCRHYLFILEHLVNFT